MINARVFADSGEAESNFDATPWFEKATDGEIEHLAGEGWERGYTADGVAEYCADLYPEVKEVFNHVNTVSDLLLYKRADLTGFEVEVSSEDVGAWLIVKRSSLYEFLKKEGYLE